MGFGLFTSGVKASIRQRKRFTVFGILFIFLSGAMIVQGFRINSYNTDNLLKARGVVITNPEPDFEWRTVEGRARGIYELRYMEISGTDLGIMALRGEKTESGELPWIMSEMKPTALTKGEFPSEKAGEALINSDYTIDQGGSVDISVAAIGAKITVNQRELKVSGIFPGEYVDDLTDGNVNNLIYVRWDDFNAISDDTQGELQRVIITAEGSYMYGKAMENRGEIRDILSKEEFEFKQNPEEKLNPNSYNTLVLQTLFTFISSIILAALYSYLVVRFRKDEIATLRAIGWTGGEIKTYILAELFALIFISYLVSLFSSLFIAYFYFGVPITSALTLLGSLGVILLTIGFGWIIISKGVLRVSPMEAFRGR